MTVTGDDEQPTLGGAVPKVAVGTGDNVRGRVFVGPVDEPDAYELLHPDRSVGGGEGTVWQAAYRGRFDRQLLYAVKRLDRPDGADMSWPDEKVRRLWDDQVRLLERVTHPHLVKYHRIFSGWDVHEAATRTGFPDPGKTCYFLLMDWVDGRSLAARIKAGDSTLAARLGWIAEIAAALDHLHCGDQTGGIALFHHDVKPANIIINELNGAVLVDCGLLRYDGDNSPTVQMFTPEYCDPWARDNPKTMGASSDLYGLAATAYHAITGDKPQPHDPKAMADRIAAATNRPAPNQKLLAAHMLTIIGNAPPSRPESASSWAATLQQIALGDVTQPGPRSLVGYRTNLPRITTPFIGGEVVLEVITEQLRVGSVVTLTGTGGVGKTRAAIEFGHRHLADFDHGVFFVDLAPVSSTGAVIGAVASTLPIVAGGEQSLLETIVDWIGERQMLLLIDNCEHLVAEVEAMVGELMARCPNLQILATSREPLGVRGERVHRVASLDTGGAAVELFCERARATDASFTPEGHQQAVVQICERLDGIPLAIELAAARMRSLTAEELLERLRDRFRLLRGSGHNTLDRHQTLRATVSWSYQLLTDDERLLFDRASVFAGGFDLRAAEMVCGFDPIDAIDVIDLVSSLVDKSMIVADRGAVGMRYRLLETLRQYGEDQMELRGETAPLRDRHAAHYADLIGELDLLSRGADQIEGEQRMSKEWDNLRAAHLWSVAQDELDRAERLAESSFQYAAFSMRHEHAAMVRQTVQLGDECGRPSTNMLGMLSYWVSMQVNEEEQSRFSRRGLDVAPSPDHPVTANCWWFAGASANVIPGSPEVLAAFQHQVAAVANTPDLDVNWWAVVCLTEASLYADPTATPALRQQLSEIAARVQSPRLTAYAHQFEGHACLTASPPDFAAAITAYGYVAEITGATGDVHMRAVALRCLAVASTGLGAPDALARCHDALDALFEIRHWPKTWQTLESITLALAIAGRTEQAAVILGHLDKHSPGFGLEHGLHFRDRARELVEAQGGHTAAKLRGARMSADELVANALAYCSTD